MLLYSLDGIRINDSWYCVDDTGIYHTYFLEYGNDEPKEYQWSRQRIGHMTSSNLLDWHYEGTVMTPTGVWDDLGLATGSVVRHGELWYMVYTGNGREISGIGLAVSRDLSRWERVGNAPVLCGAYPFEHDGEIVQVKPFCDPYIYPEAIDGTYYVFVNSYVLDRPYNARGAQAIFTTRDFCEFTPYKLAIISEFDRLETSQVWRHGDKFYMYVGAVTVTLDGATGHPNGQRSKNLILTSDALEGPYKEQNELTMPAEAVNPYIVKVLRAPDGREVMFINDIPRGVVGPYPVCYDAKGELSIQE